MNFQQLSEYLDQKGKMKTVVVTKHGDTSPPPSRDPLPAATKGKNWGSPVSLAEKPESYFSYGPNTAVARQQKYENGLANQGDKKLIYQPESGGENYKFLPTYPKVKNVATTESFLEKTKNMSLAEFATYISQQNQADQKYNPYQYINYVAKLVSENSNLMEVLVREIKKNDSMESLTTSVFKVPEVFAEVAEMLDDPGFCRKLAKAISESTDSPVDETEEQPKKKKKPKGQNAKPTKSIDGEEVDMENSPVVQTQGKVENLITALAGYKQFQEALGSFTP